VGYFEKDGCGQGDLEIRRALLPYLLILVIKLDDYGLLGEPMKNIDSMNMVRPLVFQL
jgi:hypothetical protein